MNDGVEKHLFESLSSWFFIAKLVNGVPMVIHNKIEFNCKDSMPKPSTESIAFWAKTLKGQFAKKKSKKKKKCPKCFETFKTEEGLKSHLFHLHTVEGKRRAKKKSPKRKRQSRRASLQRKEAAKKPRKSYTLEEKEAYVISFDQAVDWKEWERTTGIQHQRISDWRKQLKKGEN